MYPVALGSVAASRRARAAGSGSGRRPGLGQHAGVGRDPPARGRPVCGRALPRRVGAGRRASGQEAGALAGSTSLADAIAELPSCAAVLVEMGAEAHAAWEVRLFAS